jgi:hypothetical protein
LTEVAGLPLLPTVSSAPSHPPLHPLSPRSTLQVAGTSGKIKLDGGSDDEGAATDAYGAAISEALGQERYAQVRTTNPMSCLGTAATQ